MRAQTGAHHWRLHVLRIQILCAAPASRNTQVCEIKRVLPERQDRKYEPVEFTGDELGYECWVLNL
jgi:hypothetical protein